MAGVGLVLFACALGMPPPLHPLSGGLAIIIASISFAARGALFARSASDKGWWIAVFVVAGEAAILITASALPDSLPEWLLVLLPAQWASTAIQTAFTGTADRAASAALLALAGTAAATLLVAWLWPRRWPYLIMFHHVARVFRPCLALARAADAPRPTCDHGGIRRTRCRKSQFRRAPIESCSAPLRRPPAPPARTQQPGLPHRPQASQVPDADGNRKGSSG